MKVEISVPEVVSIFKEIQEYPENFFGITCVLNWDDYTRRPLHNLPRALKKYPYFYADMLAGTIVKE